MSNSAVARSDASIGSNVPLCAGVEPPHQKQLSKRHALSAVIAVLEPAGSLCLRNLEARVREVLIEQNFCVELLDIYLRDALDDPRIEKSTAGDYRVLPY